MYNVKDINIKNFVAEQGILPKQERTGYGMYQSPFYRNHKDLNEYIVACRLKSAQEPIMEPVRTPIRKSNNTPTSKSRKI